MSTAATLQWQEVARDESQRPSLARSGHTAARLPDSHTDDIIIVGGYTEDAHKSREASNEAWTFSLASGAWTHVRYAEGPVPRVRLAAQCVIVHNTLWLIGGWDPGHKRDGGDILNDIWTLDLGSFAWTEIQPQGDKLEPISRHQAVAVGKKIYIHTHRSLEDILVLDTSTSPPTLTKQAAHGASAPASRGLHSLTAVHDQLWLYGGAPKSGPMFGDLWVLDLPTMTWRQVDARGTQPHARCSQGAAAVQGKIYFFGGAYYREDGPGLAPLGDLCILDAQQQAWQQYTSQGDESSSWPTPRNAAIVVPVAESIVLHGGWLAFQESYNDTWVLDVGKM